MTKTLIPEDVEQFILKKVDSVAQLEGLLLLRREGNDWTEEELARRLYITSKQAAAILSSLCSDGFVRTRSTNPRTYRYEPSSPESARIVDLLADVYAKYLVPITNLIHSKPKSRVQEFADAFRLRREE